MDAVARDVTGNQIWVFEKEGETKRQDKPLTMADAHGEEILSGEVPFWSEDLHAYAFSPPGDLCSSYPDFKAVTTIMKNLATDAGKGAGPTAVTLCSFAFDAKDSLDILPPAPVGGNVVVLRDINSAPFAKGTSLGNALPKSSTIFHEYMHVVYNVEFLGGANSPEPEKCKLSSLITYLSHFVFVYTDIHSMVRR